MADIIKTYQQSVPALRFIGKKYGDSARVDGSFGAKWGEWFGSNWFTLLEKQSGVNMCEIYEDCDAYIGLMRCKENEPFEYWIGMFMPMNTPVPEGFDFHDFTESTLGVCWIYGKTDEVFFKEDQCAKKLAEEDLTIVPDETGAVWSFERYGCPRFTKPDEQDNIILDICYYIK